MYQINLFTLIRREIYGNFYTLKEERYLAARQFQTIRVYPVRSGVAVYDVINEGDNLFSLDITT